MIESIINIMKIVLAVLPFMILCFVSKKVNLGPAERSKQFIMPVVAPIYAVLMLLLLDPINTGIIKFINNIPEWINSLASFSWMPDQIAEFLKTASDTVASVIREANLAFWAFFISNTLIILVYLIVKRICMAFIRKSVKADGKLHTRVAGIFYEFISEKSNWCLKENFVQVRSMFKVFYYSAVVLSSVLMAVSSKFYYDGLLKTVFYPVFGVLVLGELYFYLDGTTVREYSGHILGEDEDAYKTVNYSLLRKYLRSVFGDKVLTENTSINNELSYNVTTGDIIRELERSEDQKIVSFATYLKSINQAGFHIEHNYLRSSLDLLNGKSILFNNPFYNDLIPYAFYPMNRALLAHEKVLVVLGRHSIEEDIVEWLENGIASVTNIPFLWNVGILNSEKQDIDIGIITRSDVLDIELHNANSEFLKKVGFFVILEPSKLISTAQIGLNLLVKKCRTSEEKKLVYCLCDKNCDGLVDAMSHILMTSITEVSATKKHLGTSSYMCWEADEEYLHHRLVPNISRYLGIGTELSFAALKNQVSKTKWFGGEAFPITDIRWIDKQYYYDLTKYANLPTGQDAMDEYFVATSNFWSATVEKNNYLTVEDESFNMFEILREFSTRTTEQGFINVISSEYLLRDYMADNASIFEADAKAIPYIVADYTRSNRNTILRLILMMSTYPVNAEFLSKELSLLGITVFDLKKQLWYELYNCYSQVSEIENLPQDYKEAVASVYSQKLKIDKFKWDHDLIETKETFNIRNGKLETTFGISDTRFIKQYVAELHSAGYVAEDEKGEKNYLGAELCGHIYQKYLPGQFFTFGGKYYEMQYLTADGQVLVRRASDHINGRPAYRQIREYVINGIKPSDKIGAQQNIEGMRVIKEFADICVNTSGYYRMEKYNDFATAKRISFEGEKNGVPKRVYRNKEILRIELPELDGKLNDNIRYTVTVLFNEIFKTIFAENQAYICALTDDSFLGEADVNRPLTYSVKGDVCEFRNNAIYIIEDSQLDLGLTVAVERNLQRIFNIIHDYLDWHMSMLEESLDPTPEPAPQTVFADPEDDDAPTKNKSVIKRFFGTIGNGIKKLLNKIKGLFVKKPPKEDDSDVENIPTDEITGDTPVNPDGETAISPEDGDEAPEMVNDNPPKKKKKGLFGLFKRKRKAEAEEKPADDGAEADDGDFDAGDFAEDVNGDSADGAYSASDAGEENREGVVKEPAEVVEAPVENELSHSPSKDPAAKTGIAKERMPYHRCYYMLYGRDCEFAFIDLRGTLDYLSEMGMQHNPLKQAREGKKIAEYIAATYNPLKPDARYCDFCGTEIYGVEYETLADGRDRCMNCSKTAIKTGEEFRRIFEDVKRNMESFYGIKINVGIKVEMVNSKTLHKRLGKAFIPTPDSDGRVLGVAIKDKNGYTLLVENGSPRMASMLTIAHELTHIWQYINWNDKAIRKKYGKKMRLEIYEGMAKWAEIQYAYLINEAAVAKREEIITSCRDDEYGHGFIRYRANYPFSLGTVITKTTPFMNVETPLEAEYCTPIIGPLPTDGTDTDLGTEPKPGNVPFPHKPVKGTIERNPEDFNRYAYSLLSEDEKSVYNLVLDAINKHSAALNDLGVKLTDTQMEKIVDYIQRDHPEILHFRHGTTYYFDTDTHIVTRLEFKYCMSQEEAAKRREEIDAATRVFLDSVSDTMSDYEATLCIYENIIKLVDYDTVGLERQKDTNLSPEVPDDLRSIYGVFVNKKAVCAGYAKAMQYLLNQCGIECVYVTSDTHAWNLIKLEGDYYHLDVTWGDGSDTKKEKEKSAPINYDCFCITTEELSRLESHTPESTLPLPVCTAVKCNYYRRNGMYFEQFDYDRMKNILCENVRDGKLYVSFKFASNRVYSDAKKRLIDDGKFMEAIQFATLKTSIKLNSRYSYSAQDNKLIIAFYVSRM